MYKVNRACPVCKQNGKDASLQLRQINFTEAVYICEDRNCIYPIGFQWEYVKNNILEDSDESSDESIKTTQINTNTLCNKLPNITKASDSKEKLNIISNVVIENSEHLQSIINKKDIIKTNENLTKSNESIRKSNARCNNKTKAQNVRNALPESVVESAKVLSEYFSSTTNQTKKSRKSIRTVFDIIQQSPATKQDASTKSKKSSDEDVLSDEARDLIKNTSIDHNYSIKENSEVDSDSSFLENIIRNEQKKFNNEINDSFDELLFSNEKSDAKNQSLDLTDMDELLSFL